MSFWTAPDLEPTRKHRFKVMLGGEFLWWAKSVTKPSFDISSNKYTAINHSIEYPGILTWNDVTLTIVDVGKKAKGLFTNIIKHIEYTLPADAISIDMKDKPDKIILGNTSRDFVVETIENFMNFNLQNNTDKRKVLETLKTTSFYKANSKIIDEILREKEFI